MAFSSTEALQFACLFTYWRTLDDLQFVEIWMKLLCRDGCGLYCAHLRMVHLYHGSVTLSPQELYFTFRIGISSRLLTCDILLFPDSEKFCCSRQAFWSASKKLSIARYILLISLLDISRLSLLTQWRNQGNYVEREREPMPEFPLDFQRNKFLTQALCVPVAVFIFLCFHN